MFGFNLFFFKRSSKIVAADDESIVLNEIVQAIHRISEAREGTRHDREKAQQNYVAAYQAGILIFRVNIIPHDDTCQELAKLAFDKWILNADQSDNALRTFFSDHFSLFARDMQTRRYDVP